MDPSERCHVDFTHDYNDGNQNQNKNNDDNNELAANCLFWIEIKSFCCCNDLPDNWSWFGGDKDLVGEALCWLRSNLGSAIRFGFGLTVESLEGDKADADIWVVFITWLIVDELDDGDVGVICCCCKCRIWKISK